MSLKKIVNDKEVWDALLQYFDERISEHHRSMEQHTSPEALYRAQGSIETLRRLKYMRDVVNGTK